MLENIVVTLYWPHGGLEIGRIGSLFEVADWANKYRPPRRYEKSAIMIAREENQSPTAYTLEWAPKIEGGKWQVRTCKQVIANYLDLIF